MSSLLEKFKKGLTKTREGLVDEIVKLVKNKYIINDELLEQIEEILISADIGVETALDIVEQLKQQVNREGFQEPEELVEVLKSQLRAHLQESGNGRSFRAEDFFSPTVKPFVIMVVGVNGTGKTTTIAKLAKVFHDREKKVLLAAADTFRAAASEQLQVWAKRANVDLVRTQTGGDAAAVAFDSLKAAHARNVDVVIVDTAGRLHTKVNLMDELKKIQRVLGKAQPEAPHEVLLVVDASTGQNVLSQAERFKSAVNVTGVVVTKLDGTAKGGMVFTIQKHLQLPVRFIGLGEAMDDLKPFEPQTFVEALFE
ncbi:signal recognition particle-docking protein FtsY [candidate division KSB1 bacterium]|nr:signal recognition particle-docking protein FtsY [candidate division KSB1 bacterium]NIR72147.1 signal recognition particle-docking protein FtsY [candidate division KSB1 bacterium]NIS26612.1 signal recognition particle-docking protein FtsY [candidate division KSB1 bacterium]NIT73380.1 signal recognition particle-docking protein FtsY [candidate division KSB1 bacterium]NIU27228.1 signal recognition particle-docking protein FtsY [candidate division KSB1 bacterium]